MTNKEIASIAVEASKLINDEPKLSYKEAIEKAKEMIVNGCNETSHRRI